MKWRPSETRLALCEMEPPNQLIDTGKWSRRETNTPLHELVSYLGNTVLELAQNVGDMNETNMGNRRRCGVINSVFDLLAAWTC